MKRLLYILFFIPFIANGQSYFVTKINNKQADSTGNVTSDSLGCIPLSVTTPNGTVGVPFASSSDIINGTSFVINSTDNGDNSSVNWWITP